MKNNERRRWLRLRFGRRAFDFRFWPQKYASCVSTGRHLIIHRKQNQMSELYPRIIETLHIISDDFLSATFTSSHSCQELIFTLVWA